MIKLEYFDGTKWCYVGEYVNENIAWVTLGTDNYNFRTVDENGNAVLKGIYVDDKPWP